MELIKRQAQPGDNAQLAAKLLHSAAPEMLDYLHRGRKPGLAFLEFEFSSETGFCSHRNTIVLADESGIVATAALTDQETHAPRFRETVLNRFKHYGLFAGFRPILRVQKVTHLFFEPDEGERYLANFAVRQDLRGMGYGRKFINMLIDDARNAGYQFFTLDVSTENPGAEALYRSVGMEAVQTQSSPIKNVPGSIKMSMPL